MFKPFSFQIKAVDKLKSIFSSLWQKPDRTSPMLLEAPTGSGKTFIASLFIKAISALTQFKNKVFLWITFSNNLIVQSISKFFKYFPTIFKDKIITAQDITKRKLQSNDILFVNWEKLVTNDAKNRKLRNSENKYFENCLTQTRLSNQEIILIIDEAHKNKDTQLAKKVINLIDPKIIFYITATPKHRDKTKSLQTYYRIPFQEVAEQGLIKETIITPKNQIALKGSELDLTLLKMGVIKREELKTEYQLLKKDINPLLLIQLPDDTKGQIEWAKVVTEHLQQLGIPKAKIAKWFDTHPKPVGLENNNSKYDVLLFKKTAGTGWDCPRASVLVMLRRIKTKIFYTQTLGRILRMPEPHLRDDYKNSPKLRMGYLYSKYRIVNCNYLKK